MKLKRLEIYGFKSFAQRTEIVFNQGITGIVGPNGSGKSNIGDAVRWVLGEQSARVLRGAKMEDVIFNGTEKRKPISYCEVSLVFDNEDNALKINYTEVMVTRRVYRNGDSEYYLNKTACRLKDILELFRDTGIGREGYSLIGQGRIDEILSVKSEDRRQVFEEAAGIMTYRVRKEESERKLERTRENLTRVQDILQELEARLGPMEEQAKATLAYRELSGRLKQREVNHFLARYDRAQERAAALAQTLEGLRDAMLAHQARLNDTNQTRAQLSVEAEALEEQTRRARQEQMLKSSALSDAQSAILRAEQDVQTKLDEQARIAQEAENTRLMLQQREALVQKGRTDEESSRALLAKVQSELEQAQASLDAAAREAQTREDALEAHKNAIVSAINRLGDARSQLARCQATRAQMDKRLCELRQSERDMAKDEETLAQVLADAKDKHRLACDTLKALQDEAQQIEARLRALSAQQQDAISKAQQLKLQAQATQTRLNTLQDMARALDGYSMAVKSALQYAKADPHVHGAVAQLIHAPKEIETAVDIALGAALQNIVTDDENTAKRIIEYLRQSHAGRATFLPLSAIQPRTLTMQERRLLDSPGCLGVASELVTYDKAYQTVVDNLLGRTVIAQSLDAGIPIMRAGRHAFKLVTLQGDVMSPGGSMTGGAAQTRGTSLLGREREIAELTERAKKEQRELSSLLDDAQALDRDRAALKAQRNEAMERCHQEEIGVAREQEHAQSAEQALREHAARTEQVRQAIESLSEGLAETDADIERLSQQTGEETVDQEAMAQKTLSLQQALTQARAQTDALRETVTAQRLSYAELEHTLDVIARDSARFAQEMDSAEKQLARARVRAEQLNADIAQAGAQKEACRARAETLSKEAKESAQRCDALETQRQETTARERECVTILEQIHQAESADSEKLHRTELAQTRVENEIKTMCDYMWSNYQLTYANAEELREPGKIDMAQYQREIDELKDEIRQMGVINVRAVEDYQAEKARYDDLSAQQKDLLKAEGDLQGLITRLLSQMEKVFVSQFDKLAGFFQETFTRLFGGGQAALRLSDPSNALSCGIDIVAQPPGKKLQLLSLLSGGERSLTAIAILFAMLKLKPTPFCILDEIEAALDDANIGYFADYLAEYAKTTQFVVVTHRKGTMERCDSLYGVAMQEQGVSGMVSVNLEDYK